MKKNFCILLAVFVMLACGFAQHLVLAQEQIERKYILGVEVADLKDSSLQGVTIVSVGKNSPAQRYGLKEGDIVTLINNKVASNVFEFIKSINESNGVIICNVVRNGNNLQLKVPLMAIAKNAPTQDIRNKCADRVLHNMFPKSKGRTQEIYGINLISAAITPAIVNPGAKFDLSIEYFIADPIKEGKQVNFELTYSIFQDKEKLFEDTVTLEAPAGQCFSSTKEGLVASKQAGTYELKVVVQYRDKFSGQITELIIQ